MDALFERPAWRINGFLLLLINLVIFFWSVLGIITAARLDDTSVFGPLGFGIVGMIVGSIMTGGFFVVHPNESRVLIFFGRYVGSVRDSGFWWTNPFTVKKRLSLRVHNFNSEKLKVNDAQGNPIEIAAVIVWRVVDSAKAMFDVENYEQFVAIQSETAIRGMASTYPYDSHEEGESSLRGSPSEVADNLRGEVHNRLEIAGVEVLDARISHLAYAPEIAQAMLRRQQAQAIIAARQKIVEGAVGMVQMALQMLSDQKLVQLDEERKAAMVNNLLVALVSEQETQPIINTGTLFG